MNVQVRDAQPDDAPYVVRLIRELAAADGDQSPITDDYAVCYLRAAGCGVLLAEADGQIAGLLSYSIRPDLYHGANSGLIETLIVSEPYRGCGIGSTLLSVLLGRLESIGCAEVSVTTMPDNEGALRFYRSHGLTEEAVYLEKHFASAR